MTWLTLRVFIAFFFVLFGVGIIFRPDQFEDLIGAFIAALGLTFFWRLWIAIRAGK
jgi:hypothetical protein